jgi:hypothetical protein
MRISQHLRAFATELSPRSERIPTPRTATTLILGVTFESILFSPFRCCNVRASAESRASARWSGETWVVSWPAPKRCSPVPDRRHDRNRRPAHGRPARALSILGFEGATRWHPQRLADVMRVAAPPRPARYALLAARAAGSFWRLCVSRSAGPCAVLLMQTFHLQSCAPPDSCKIARSGRASRLDLAEAVHACVGGRRQQSKHSGFGALR